MIPSAFQTPECRDVQNDFASFFGTAMKRALTLKENVNHECVKTVMKEVFWPEKAEVRGKKDTLLHNEAYDLWGNVALLE